MKSFAMLALALAHVGALAADEAALQRVLARVAEAGGPWCGRSSTLGEDGVRRCILRARVAGKSDSPPLAVQIMGVVAVTPALLAAVDEDQLAFVLSHEVAHLALGHARLRASQRAEPATAVEQALRAMQEAIGNPPPEGTPADPLAQELDADALGLALAVRAGYAATAAARLFDLAEQGRWPQGIRYPAHAERAQHARDMAQQLCRVADLPAMPAQPRLQPQPEYRLQEALQVRLPPAQCAGV
jgi:hypothetical protein